MFTKASTKMHVMCNLCDLLQGLPNHTSVVNYSLKLNFKSVLKKLPFWRTGSYAANIIKLQHKKCVPDWALNNYKRLATSPLKESFFHLIIVIVSDKYFISSSLLAPDTSF